MIPRRCHLDKNTPEELAIRAAIQAVEENLPADVRLTNIVILLDTARELLSDYIDDVAKV